MIRVGRRPAWPVKSSPSQTGAMTVAREFPQDTVTFGRRLPSTVPNTKQLQTNLVKAVQLQDVTEVRWCLDHGARPNQPDPVTGKTALQLAWEQEPVTTELMAALLAAQMKRPLDAPIVAVMDNWNEPVTLINEETKVVHSCNALNHGHLVAGALSYSRVMAFSFEDPVSLIAACESLKDLLIKDPALHLAGLNLSQSVEELYSDFVPRSRRALTPETLTHFRKPLLKALRARAEKALAEKASADTNPVVQKYRILSLLEEVYHLARERNPAFVMTIGAGNKLSDEPNDRFNLLSLLANPADPDRRIYLVGRCLPDGRVSPDTLDNTLVTHFALGDHRSFHWLGSQLLAQSAKGTSIAAPQVLDALLAQPLEKGKSRDKNKTEQSVQRIWRAKQVNRT